MYWVTRVLKLGTVCGLLGSVAYLLMRVGDFVAGGGSNLLSINAFLFLVGLSGACALLSPAPVSRHRYSISRLARAWRR